jgi:hypothetical protein
VDGFAVYEVLARDGPGFTLAHCWAHTKRKYDEIATNWPTACAEIDALIGELHAIERLVPGPFPGDAAAQTLRQQLRTERSQRSSIASGSGPPNRWVCRAAISAKPSATC